MSVVPVRVALIGMGRMGQALDARLIDRVQIYLAPVLSGGPVPAFAARGAGSTAEAARLREVRYEKVGAEIFLTGKTTYGGPRPE